LQPPAGGLTWQADLYMSGRRPGVILPNCAVGISRPAVADLADVRQPGRKPAWRSGRHPGREGRFLRTAAKAARSSPVPAPGGERQGSRGAGSARTRDSGSGTRGLRRRCPAVFPGPGQPGSRIPAVSGVRAGKRGCRRRAWGRGAIPPAPVATIC